MQAESESSTLKYSTIYPKMAAWGDNVTCLIMLWSDDAVQAKLEGCKKNRDVFKRISKDMREAGFDRSGVQCHDKI